MRVLIVDDHQDSREMLHELLTFHSIDSDMAADGAEALAKLRSNKFDGALIDLHLPKITGIDLIRRIRDTREMDRMFVVIVSGEAAQPADREFVAAHTEATLMKPYDIAKLIDVLERAAGLRKERSSANG